MRILRSARVAAFALLAFPASSADARPTTEAAGQAFARSLESTIAVGDPTVFKNGFDCRTALERALAPIDSPAQMKAEFTKGAAEGCGSFGDQIAALATQGGSYKLLRVRPVGGAPRALFRLIHNDAVNYHDLVLEDARGKTKVVDIHVYLTGELFSETIRRTYVTALASDESLMSKLSGEQSDFVKHLPKIREMQTRREAKDYAGALKSYYELPRSLQKDRNMLFERFTSASEVGGKEYDKALAAFRRHHPNDKGLDLVMVDGFFLRKQYDQAISAIDRVDAAVGGDPYLKVLRANVFLEKKEAAKSRALLNDAVKEEPGLSQAWFGLLNLAVMERNHQETTRLLTEIEAAFPAIRFTAIETTPEFGEYVQTADYRAWKKSRKE